MTIEHLEGEYAPDDTGPDGEPLPPRDFLDDVDDPALRPRPGDGENTTQDGTEAADQRPGEGADQAEVQEGPPSNS